MKYLNKRVGIFKNYELKNGHNKKKIKINCKCNFVQNYFI